MSAGAQVSEALRRFRPYPKSRETGIEWMPALPAHWGVTRLKNVAAVRPSNVDKHTVDGEQAVRLCNYTDVYYNEQVSGSLDFMQASASEDEIRRFMLALGDVLVTKDSETPGDIAVPAYVAENLPGVLCGYHLAHIRPAPERLEGAYLARAFVAEGICDQFRAAAKGVTRFGLSAPSIMNALFPEPPLVEQRAIASFLGRETAKIDALVEKKERLIELLQEKRTALVTRAVTNGLDPDAPMKPSGIPWLGEIPAHWEVHHLRRVVKRFIDYRGRTPIKTDSGVPLITAGAIRDGEIDHGRCPEFISEEDYDGRRSAMSCSPLRRRWER
jgi:type I restriction enzyme S subunit